MKSLTSLFFFSCLLLNFSFSQITLPPPPPPPPSPPLKPPTIFKVVEEMPTFPGCEDEGNKSVRRDCAQSKMMEYFGKNLKYPAIARENGVEGTVVASFIVNTDGSISNPKILRNIGAGCGDEVIRLVKKMPVWNPGKQRGRAVTVQFNVPIEFKLDNSPIKQREETEVVQEKPEYQDEQLPPPPPPSKANQIYRVVEQMPTFPGCEDKTDKKERKTCAQKKMLEFIYDNLQYPAEAKKNGVEGTVVVTYVVEKDGSLTDVKVIRDIGAECGDEALRLVKSMPNWLPGKQRGREVRVQYNLPVRFKL